MGIGVLNDSAIKTPKDRERRQMASTVTSREYPFWPAVSGHDGFDLSKVSIVQYGAILKRCSLGTSIG
jgi:hypothetical protein